MLIQCKNFRAFIIDGGYQKAAAGPIFKLYQMFDFTADKKTAGIVVLPVKI